MSIPMEEAWFERMVADQGKTGYMFTVCLLADDRPMHGTLRVWHVAERAREVREDLMP